jgi:hypothetical protein
VYRGVNVINTGQTDIARWFAIGGVEMRRQFATAL